MPKAPALVALALLFAAACGGSVVFVEQADGGAGGPGGQGGAHQDGPIAAGTNMAATTGTGGCTLPPPMSELHMCGATNSGDSCGIAFCDLYQGHYVSTCTGAECQCEFQATNAPTFSCGCTAAGDVCTGAAPSCCWFAN